MPSERTKIRRVIADVRRVVPQGPPGPAGATGATGPAGAGLSDGDKGDITVSGSGAAWAIDAGVVTTTKLGGDITAAGKALLDDADAAAQRTTLGLGTAATQPSAAFEAAGTASGAVSTHAALTSSVHGISAYGATLVDDANAAGARTTLELGTLATQSGTFSGTSSGTNTGDNAVNSLYSGLVSNATHTGEVTGATALTIAAAAVTLAKMANLAANSLLGNNTGAPATPLALTPAQVKTLLAIANTDISGLGTLSTQSGTFSGTSSGTNTGDNAVNTLYSGLVSNATHTGEVTGSVALTIANDAVTFAKMQNSTVASRLVGRGSALGAGDFEEITLGTNLSMSGTTLNASGGGANTLYAPGSVTVATGNFALHVQRLQLTTTQRMTLAGTARLRLSN